MLHKGKTMEIADEMEKYKIDIIALQEVRWEKQRQIDSKHFTMVYSGEEKQGRNGYYPFVFVFPLTLP